MARMKAQLLLLVLLGVALATPKSSTEVQAHDGVIYNDAALDEDDAGWIRNCTTPALGPILTFEVRLDTVWPNRENVLGSMPVYSLKDLDIAWRLYVTQTVGDTVRRFRVCRLLPVEEEPPRDTATEDVYQTPGGLQLPYFYLGLEEER